MERAAVDPAAPLDGRTTPAGDKNIVNSVLKAAKLVELLSAHQPDMSLAELASATEMTKSTTRRLLATLEEAGWVTRVGDGRYKMTIRLFEIAAGIADGIDLRTEALPAMRRLRDAFGETVYLYVLDQGRAVCLERIEGTRPFRIVSLRAGSVTPLTIGAAPTALLAFHEPELLDRAWREAQTLERRPFDSLGQLTALLARIRVEGYSFTVDDVTAGVAAIGAPIHDLYGNTVAALSVAGQREHLDSDQKPAMVAALLEATGEVSRRLGHNSAPHRR
ncbi:IclR family transcriptional regulator [Phytohabitans kaempferiae]|uniref:IclR family transcriptional regulator n=1 Tax=Phytohabitans kaempferiae TaxID=1620943 RepID=A0ABV6M4C2_9ACTN